MILIEKPTRPEKLSEGCELVQSYCDDFDSFQESYINGKRFSFEREIYGDQTVRTLLAEAQNDKCCYCEGKIGANARADVEHFRPKGFSQQETGMPKIYPGYYWLVYDWDNLFLSCQICNREHKRNLFPLRDPASRVRCHSGDVATENPLLLNPGGPEDPRDHIVFHNEVATGKTEEGQTTINVTGMNRIKLTEKRLEKLINFALYWK